MSPTDSEAIVQIVNQVHPGHRYLQIEDMAHDFTLHDKFYDQLIPTILDQRDTGRVADSRWNISLSPPMPPSRF